jgi:hypothetical protein
MNNIARILVIYITVLLISACAAPDESATNQAAKNAGFLTDYALLSKPDWEGVVKAVYIDPQLARTVERYSGVMVDQPEVFISVASPYRGVKPDGIKMVADQMRFLLIGEMLRSGYNVVEAPGEDIVYLRVALTDLDVAKVAGASGYVPIAEGEQGEAERVRAFMSTLRVIDGGQRYQPGHYCRYCEGRIFRRSDRCAIRLGRIVSRARGFKCRYKLPG